MQLSENIRRLEPSATIAVSSRAKELRAEGRDIINLGAGEPDFDTPDAIAEAGIAAIRDGHTRYTPAAGLPELRRTIARSIERAHDRTIDPAGIVVSSGAKQALFNACFALFGPGDRVLLPVPYWTSYPAILELSRAEAAHVRTDPDNGFKASIDDLDAAYDPAVRGLVLNTPVNPTGAVYARDELEAIARWAAERDLWIVSDEIYGRLRYPGGDRAPGVLDLDPELLERTVLIDGASKAFAMTGWRIGYSCTAPELANAMTAIQSHTTSNASSPAQYAAITAFGGSPEVDRAVRSMVDAFDARRRQVLEQFDEHLPDVSYVQPEGAFYLFFRIDRYLSDAEPDSTALCRALLEQTGVAVVPGAAFGDDRYARLSFAASEAELTEGIGRIASALDARAPSS